MGFLDLPAELREVIYKFALYHGENEGFIAPVADVWKTHFESQASNYLAIVQGKACILSCYRYTQEDLWDDNEILRRIDGKPARDDHDGCSARKESNLDSRSEVRAYTAAIGAEVAGGDSGNDLDAKQAAIDKKKVFFRGHVCSPACLLQPALTQASRQVRANTLPIFYGVNKFVFDTRNFRAEVSCFNGASRELDDKVSLIPKMWWRAIGDTNLRAINHLRIVRLGGTVFGTEDKVKFEFTYEKAKGKAEVMVVRNSTQKGTMIVRGCLPDGNGSKATSTGLQVAQQVMEDGLFVRGIERILFAARAHGRFVFGVEEADWPDINRQKGEERDEDDVGRGDIGKISFGEFY